MVRGWSDAEVEGLGCVRLDGEGGRVTALQQVQGSTGRCSTCGTCSSISTPLRMSFSFLSMNRTPDSDGGQLQRQP